MDDKRWLVFAAVLGGLGVLFAGISLLVAAWNAATTLFVGSVLTVFQLLLLGTAVVFFVFVVAAFCRWVLTELDRLRRAHAELVREVARRRAPVVAMLALVAQAAIVISDKTFRGDPVPTVTITLLLVVLFYCANEFFLKHSKLLRALGLFLWLFSVFALPLFVWVDRGFDSRKVIEEAMQIPFPYKVGFGLSLPILLILPFSLGPLRGLTSACNRRPSAAADARR